MCESSELRLLGKRLATYRPELDHRHSWLATFFFSIFVGLGTFWQFSGQGHDLLALVAIGPLVCFLYFWWRIRNHSRQCVHLHQHGFTIDRYRRSSEFLWSEISAVYQVPLYGRRAGVGQQNHCLVKIDLADGQGLRLRSFEGIRSLVSCIQEQLVRRMMSRYQQAYLQGRWIRFGKRLSVGLRGICVGVRLVNWHQINTIVIDEVEGIRIGCTSVPNEWLRLPIRCVANLHLLSELLAWIRRSHITSVSDAESATDDRRAVSVSDFSRDGISDWEKHSVGATSLDEFVDDRWTGDAPEDDNGSRPRHPK